MTDDGPQEPPLGRADEAGGGFSALFERFWDSTVADHVTDRQVVSIERHLCLLPGARIVVAPSGCGRLALALAARGYAVRGVDRCSDAIERSSALAVQARLGVEFRFCPDLTCGDADCDGAIAIGTGLMSGAVAARLAAALKPGARAIIEVGHDETASTLSQALDEAGLEPIGRHDEWDEDSYAAPARSFLICARA